MGKLLEDTRFGFRILARNPGFTIGVVLIMALAIGANSTVFAVVDAILVRPLPAIANPASLVAVYRTLKGEAFDSANYPDYADYRDRNQWFSGLAAHVPAPLSFSDGTAERLHGELVTGNYFAVLGVKAAAGRLLVPEDDTTGAPAVAVLSYRLWQRKFGGNAEIAGTSILLNGHPFTVSGVAADGFRGTSTDDSFDVWVPLSTQPQTLSRLSKGILGDRAAGWLQLFGRLKPGVKFKTAEAGMKTIAAQLAATYPVTNEGRSVNLARGVGLYPDDRAEVSGLLALLSGAAALLLLIACSNVAGLFSARALGRRREIAVRLAVGATRARLVRQLLTEGILIAMVAGALGLLFSAWAKAFVVSLSERASILRQVDLSTDSPILGVTLLASVLAGILFALLPAMQAMRADVIESLKNGSPGGGSRRAGVRSALVVSQVALAFILLSGAGLLLRDLYRMLTANPGFETRNVAMMSIDLSTLPYSRERGIQIYSELLQKVRATPGVISASLAATVPPEDFSLRDSIFYPGQEPPPDVFHGHSFELGLRVDIDTIAPHYFDTLGIALLHGRDFTDRDRAGTPGVVIVGSRLAERLWPGENAVGKRLSWPDWGGAPRPPLEVIGVAADARYRSIIDEPPLLMYVPVFENYGARTRVVVRTSADPRGVISDLQAAIHGVDPDAPLYNPQTMSEHAASSLWQQRMAASWIAALSLMSLALAAIGLYGAIAQRVAERTSLCENGAACFGTGEAARVG